MCEKLSFDTFREAQTIVNQASKIGRRDRRRQASKKPKRVYKCEVCGSYHLTSYKKKSPRWGQFENQKK